MLVWYDSRTTCKKQQLELRYNLYEDHKIYIYIVIVICDTFKKIAYLQNYHHECL